MKIILENEYGIYTIEEKDKPDITHPEARGLFDRLLLAAGYVFDICKEEEVNGISSNRSGIEDIKHWYSGIPPQ